MLVVVSVCATGVGTPFPPGPAALAPTEDESHQVGASDTSCGVPPLEVVNEPSGFTIEDIEPSSTPNFTLCRPGSAAAYASLMTRTSDMPTAVAVTCRSTPGITAG